MTSSARAGYTAELGGGNRKDFGLRKLKDSLQHAFRRRKNIHTPRPTAIIETDFLPAEENSNKTPADNVAFCPGGSYGTFAEDNVEETTSREIARRLQETIRDSRCSHGCELLLPSGLLGRIAADVVRMSQCEPCGLRGCVIYMNVQEKRLCRRLGRLVYDPHTVPTFELYLTLLEDEKHWRQICELVKATFASCLMPHRYHQIVISPGFQLLKKKLYRPEH